MADVWSQLGQLVAKRIDSDGGKWLTPDNRASAEKQGVAVPQVAYDPVKQEAYSYFSSSQVAAIQAGTLTKTTDINAEIGKRGGGAVVASPAGNAPMQDVKQDVNAPIFYPGWDPAQVATPNTPINVVVSPPAGGTSGNANDPHPFAGTNVEEMMGVGIAAIFIVMSFKLVGGLIGGRK